MPESARKKRQERRNSERAGPVAIQPKTPKQATYLDALKHCDSVLAIGPAGTGKTYLAAAFAAAELHARNCSQVILTRPLIGVEGKTMGFLPGNVAKKMEPWSRPLVEAFKRHMGTAAYEKAALDGSIEVMALEHLRGLTFDDAVVIIDEAQNTSPLEMKAILTRLGEHSRLIICGDQSQSDLKGAETGLAWAVEAVDRGLVPDVVLIEFHHADTVRSARCAQWAAAFDVLAKEKASR